MEDIRFINETYDVFERYGCNNKEKIEDDLLLLDAWLMEVIFYKLPYRLGLPRIKFSREGNCVKYEGREYKYDDGEYEVRYELSIRKEDFFSRYSVLGESKVEFIYSKLFELKNSSRYSIDYDYETPKYGDFQIQRLNPFRRKFVDRKSIKEIILLLQEFWQEKWKEVRYLNLGLISVNKDLVRSLDLGEIIDELDADLKINFIFSEEARKRDVYLYQVLEKLRELGVVFVVEDFEIFLCNRFKGGGVRILGRKYEEIYLFLNKEVQFGNSSLESYSRS